MIGGAVSNYVLMVRSAAALEIRHRNVITAKEFRLLDEDGNIRAVLDV